MPTRGITLMSFDSGAKARRFPKRLRTIRGIGLSVFHQLIWMAVFASTAMTWAAGEGLVAHDPERLQIRLNVSEHPPAPDAQADTDAKHGGPETNADRVFRDFMLPGAALLVIIISIVLVAIFFPQRKTE